MYKKYLKDKLKGLFFSYRIQSISKSERKKISDKKRTQLYKRITLTRNQKDKIDNFFTQRYGRKVSYNWHRLYMSYTGNFDEKYMPEIIYTSLFETYMNLNERYKAVYSDKAILELFAKSADVRMPKTIIVCVNGQFMVSRDGDVIDLDTVKQKLNNIGEVFIKPTIDSNSGKGCILADFINGRDVISDRDLFDILCSMGLNYIVQEKIICHESITQIYSKSVNTLRIMSYKWFNEFYHMPIIMRIGQGGSILDNAHAGGMFIAVEEDGRMHKKAFTEFNNQFVKHPDTDFVFSNHQIKGVEKVLDASVRMHKLMPELGVISFDFTVNQFEEPILIEANCKTGSIWLPQIAHGKGGFGDLTGEVLNWISFMESLDFSELQKYQFGKTSNNQF